MASATLLNNEEAPPYEIKRHNEVSSSAKLEPYDICVNDSCSDVQSSSAATGARGGGLLCDSDALTKEDIALPMAHGEIDSFQPSQISLAEGNSNPRAVCDVVKLGTSTEAPAMRLDENAAETFRTVKWSQAAPGVPSPSLTRANGGPELLPAESAAWNPLEEVDSALLSALSDARERKGLLRLEHVLVDFMKERTAGYIEVGGPYNSIIVSSQTSNTASGDPDRPANVCHNLAGGAPRQLGQDAQYQQQQRGARQTSFQRLILHRLADRFNIVRENVSPSNDRPNSEASPNMANLNMLNSYLGATTLYPPGLIRLVKVKESCIPTHLLIDIDLSLLVNYKSSRPRRGSGGAGLNTDDVLKSATEDLSCSNLSDAHPTGASSARVKSNRKMTIMKRNSSGSGGSNLSDLGKNRVGNKREVKSRNGLKGKKLVDREKAYEEARARIFGVRESNLSENTCGFGNGEKGDEAPTNLAQDIKEDNIHLDRSPSSLSLENDGSYLNDATCLPCIVKTSQGSISTPPCPPSTSQTSYPPQPQKYQAVNSAETNEADSMRYLSLSSSSVPAALTGGAVSKAVYRNRQQEENDPDFKRRSDVRPAYVNMAVVQNGIPLSSAGVGVSTTVPNLYGGNTGYLNMATMTQPPPSSSMIVMQAHKSHPHFYGQSPPHTHNHTHSNSQKGPSLRQQYEPLSPQDATYSPHLSTPSPPHQYFLKQHAYHAASAQEKQAQNRQRHSRQMQVKHNPETSGKHGSHFTAQFSKSGLTNVDYSFNHKSQQRYHKIEPSASQWGSSPKHPTDGHNRGDDVAIQVSCINSMEKNDVTTRPNHTNSVGMYRPEDFPVLR